jgi:hypothetical protein
MNGNPPKPQVALRSTLREGLPYHESSSLSYRPFDARRDRGVRSMGAWLVRVRAVLEHRKSSAMQRDLSARKSCSTRAVPARSGCTTELLAFTLIAVHAARSGRGMSSDPGGTDGDAAHNNSKHSADSDVNAAGSQPL